MRKVAKFLALVVAMGLVAGFGCTKKAEEMTPAEETKAPAATEQAAPAAAEEVKKEEAAPAPAAPAEQPATEEESE